MPAFRPLLQTKFINDASLISYWKLANTTDEKGTYNLTNVGSATFSAGLFGNAVDFGSANSTKQLNSATFVRPVNITISTWIKTNQTTLSKVIVGGDDVGSGSAQRSFQLATNATTGYVQGVIFNASSNNALTASINVCDDNWHNIILTYSGTQTNLYIDGKLQANDSVLTGNMRAGTGIAIGNLSDEYATDTFYRFCNLVNDTAIFSRALSASEVNELYQGMTYGEYLGAGSATTKLLLHLNGSSVDSSGNGNNGTDTAITYVDGKFGKCASFNGSSAINLPYANSSFPYTVVTWFKTTTKTADATLWTTFAFSPNRGNTVRLTSTNGYIMVYGSTWFTGTVGLADGNWHCCVVSVASSTSTKTYIDGKLVLNDTGTSAVSSANIRIGQTLAGESGNYTGLLDEFIDENRAWTPQQVAKYYSYAKGYYATL